MANIFDYLDWRSDLLFSYDSFNDIDNLVLSELAYVDYEGVLGIEDERIDQVAKKYFEMHTKKEINKRKTFYHSAPFLLEKLKKSKRFKEMVLHHYVNQIDGDQSLQMSAITFVFSDFIYVAYRGTDDTLIGWKEDFDFSYKMETEGQKRALAYLEEVAQAYSQKIYVGGHSKGANFALYAAMHSSKKVQSRIKKVYFNDGPGFLSEGWEGVDEKFLKKVKRISPENSTIGVLLENPIHCTHCKSDQKGVMQHDLLSWQVLGNRLVTSHQTKISQLFEKTIEEWIHDVDLENRQQFVDHVFEIFENAGIYCLEDISKHQIQIIKSINALPKEQSSHIQSLLIKLLGSSLDVFIQSVKNREG